MTRPAFESAMRANGWTDADLAWRGDDYRQPQTAYAWMAWQEGVKHEREECAKVVEECAPPRKPLGGRVEIGESARAAFAAAIRARG